MVRVVQQEVLNVTQNTDIEEQIQMLIVGQVSTPEEAAEIEFIAKYFVVAHRVKSLVQSKITG